MTESPSFRPQGTSAPAPEVCSDAGASESAPFTPAPPVNGGADTIACVSRNPVPDAGIRRLGPNTVERLDLGTPHLLPGQRVDVIVACHNPARPVGRAVASLLEGNPQAAVTVACHNRRAEEIAAVIAPEHRERVRYLEHTDPRPSASGPFNAGMRASRTPWVSIMGSDDQLAPGAVASWLRLARVTGAEMVVPRLALGTPDHTVPTPAVRPSRLLAPLLLAADPRGRRRPAAWPALAWRLAVIGRGLARTEIVADRLSYRSAPLGLLSVAMLQRTGAALVEGAGVGGDVGMVTRLFAEVPTAYDALGPVYLIGEDASDRVTYVVRPMEEQVAFLDRFLDEDWFTSLDLEARQAIAAKMTRIHVFGAVHYRDREDIWTPTERESLRATCLHLEQRAPGYARILSRAECDLLDACLDPSIPAATLIAASARRRRHGRPDTLIPRDLTQAARREAPLRFMAASLATTLAPRLLGRLMR